MRYEHLVATLLELRAIYVGRGWALWWVLLAAATLPIAFRQVTISDAWWHIAIGKWLVHERCLPDLSRFYFPPTNSGAIGSELRWQWLGDILLYLSHAGIGAFGLQLLSIGCLFVAFLFLRRIGGDTNGPWALLLMAAVCLGTYQLQMPRNSVFSLALYPALLWLGCRKTGTPKLAEYAWVAVLLLVWSFLHGSCVMGWITAALLFAPRALAGFAGPKPRADESGRQGPHPSWLGGLRSVGLYAAAMFVSLALISLGRTEAYHLLGQPLRHIARPALELASGGVATPGSSAETTPPLRAMKEWFNASIWTKDPFAPWSNDYWSPFDMLPGNRPIEAAYGLALLALLVMLLARNVPFGLALAWGASFFLGLGYVRMFGYLAISSAAVIMVAARVSDGRWSSPSVVRLGWAGVAVWLGYVWTLLLAGGLDRFIPEGQHVPRVGQVPIYDDAVADWVKSEFPREKVFTTIETGSYCLLRWNFEKQVFIDGFFAPHTREVWNVYHGVRNRAVVAPLHEKFGITLAVIPTTSKIWIDHFRLSADWRPIAIGNGAAVFAHRSLSRAFSDPKIFAGAEELRSSSHYYRYSTLKALFLVASRQYERGPGFPPEAWTSLPEFGPLRDMAGEVFPVMDARVGQD
jgi:hypothetical protein